MDGAGFRRGYPFRVLPQTLAPEQRVATPRTPGRPPRLTLLDGLRFLAALAVVGYHFTGLKTTVWGLPTMAAFPHLHEVTRYGYLGVDLFFFISGFVILMTAWGRELPAYVGSRVARLFPGYWAGVLLTGGLLLATSGVAGKEVTIPQVITNLSMLQERRRREPRRRGLLDALGGAAVLPAGRAAHAGRHHPPTRAGLRHPWPVVAALATTTEQAFVSELLLGQWAPYFAAGMLLYLVHREGWSPLLAWGSSGCRSCSP